MSESVACSNCSGEILFDDKFCRHCGVSKEVKPAYCPKCKNEWKDDSKFCSNCGSSIRPSDAPSIKPAVTAKNDEATDVREIFRQVWERRRKIQEAHNSEDGIDPKVLTEIPGEEMVDSAEEAYSKGQSAFRQHDYATAAKNYSLAIELDSEDERYYRGRGLCYELNGWEVDWPKAVDDYTQAIRLNPTRADNYLKRGRFWDLDAIRAHEDLETALKLDPSLAEAHYMLGNIWSNAGNHEEAIESFDKGIHLNSGDPYPFLNRARSYGKLGDLNSAIEDYGKAIDLDTTLEAAYFERGHIYWAQNQYSKALTDFEWCIEQHFKPAWAMLWAGECFYTLGDLEKAEVQYTRLLEIDPESNPALTGLGKVAYMQNDYPTAIDLFSKAFAYEDNYECLNWRGTVRYLSGDYQGALEDYLFCIEQDPPEPWEYHQRCCDCYDALGQYEKAKDSLDKVFELGHGSKELTSYRDELNQKLIQ